MYIKIYQNAIILNTLIISIIINRRTVVIILVKLYQVNRTCVQNMGTCIISIHMHIHFINTHVCTWAVFVHHVLFHLTIQASWLVVCCRNTFKNPTSSHVCTNKEIRNRGHDQIHHKALRAFWDWITPDRIFDHLMILKEFYSLYLYNLHQFFN